MVDLVLEHPGLEPRGLDQLLLALLVLRAHADMDRPLDLDQHARQRQAALLERLALLAGPLDRRVHDGGDRRVRVDAVDEQPVHHADLGRRQPDPERVVHDLAHAPDLLRQAVVEALDLERPAAQDGVAVLAYELERGVAAGAGLGVDPVLERLGLLRGARRRDLVLFGHGTGVYCGSTSTLKVTARCARSRAAASTAAPVARTASARARVRTTTWKRSRPRRRNSGAGPSTSVCPRPSTAAATAPAAARAAAPSSPEQTTRIRSANGG